MSTIMGRRGLRNYELNLIRNPECTACPLHKSSENVCVMGRGNLLAKIMLVGEAPGANEATTGLPFMGKAGMFLNSCLHDLGMSHMVYISNVCRCRPPNNRTPTPAEMATCTRLYLHREIMLLRPEVLVLLGRTPINHFYKGRPFKRGEAKTMQVGIDREPIHTFMVVPAWHPSFIVNYNAGNHKLVDDFKSQLNVAKMTCEALQSVASR